MRRAESPRSFAGFNHLFIYSAAGTIILALLLYMAGVQARHTRALWPQTSVKLLAERSVLTNVYEGHTGGGLIYQGEVQASYYAEGKHFQQWIPVLSASGDRNWLAFQLNALSLRNCSVRWEPGRPEDPVLEC